MGDFRDFYLEQTGQRITAERLGEKLGLSRPTMTRRLTSGEGLSAEEIITLSRELNLPVIKALIDQGKLTNDDISRYITDEPANLSSIQSVSEEQLAEEVLRRMRVGVTTENLTLDVNEVAERLTRKPAEDTTPVKPDLHAVKEKNGIPYTDDGEPDYDAIVDGINAGTERFAAQRATEPLEEHFT